MSWRLAALTTLLVLALQHAYGQPAVTPMQGQPNPGEAYWSDACKTNPDTMNPQHVTTDLAETAFNVQKKLRECAAQAPFRCGDVLVRTQSNCVSWHICEERPINYTAINQGYTHPPLCGPHRALWPRHGTFSALPPQRFLHSLEHGAFVFLLNPCASLNTMLELRKWILASPYHPKWIWTSYALTMEWGVLYWGSGFFANCFDAEIRSQLDAFARTRFNTAPESSVAASGPYDTKWLSAEPGGEALAEIARKLASTAPRSCQAAALLAFACALALSFC